MPILMVVASLQLQVVVILCVLRVILFAHFDQGHNLL